MDGVGLDNTIDPDGNPVDARRPCSTKTLDVKATDHDVPLLTELIPIRPDAKSKARVEIRQVVEQSGMLPWAVPEVDPAAVVALFVNEDSGDVVAAQRLTKRDVATLPFLEWRTSPPGDPFGVSKVDLAGREHGRRHPRIEGRPHALDRRRRWARSARSRRGSSSATRGAAVRTGSPSSTAGRTRTGRLPLR